MKEMKTHADVKAKVDSNKWFYSDEVKEHFFKPKNFMKESQEKKFKADGIGMVGSPACGDMMKIWIKVEPKKDRIISMKWRTFGCASAIASTSVLSVMVSEKEGMKLNKALKIKPQDIAKRLKGLPARKFHCSVLGDKALRSAINDYFRKTGQINRIIDENARVIDKETGVSDKDIEEAVLEGASTLEEVQQKLKVGVSNKRCLPEVEQLIRFYKEKYFGAQNG
jgi:NifU-like protein involved in Fe-S cluster formation/bacterioferritin-associated ferredoxin